MRLAVKYRQQGSYFKWAACTALAFVILFTLFDAASASDARSIRFQHISRDDGLSQSFVYDIVQDQQGFMWFATQEGLNKFDGVEFTVFAHDPLDPQSISDESIRTIYEDSSGTLWIGSDAGGLSRYNTAQQTFTNYLHDAADISSIADNRVRVIYEDNAGALWIGTDGSGLDRFDRESGTFVHYPFDPSTPGNLGGAHVWSILQTSDGTLWIATDGGLSQYDSGNNTFINIVHDPDDASSLNDNSVRTLHEDRENNLWIGTETGGLNRYDQDTGSFEHFVHNPEDASTISADRINTIFEDDAGVLWFGTDNGLNAWNPATDSFERYFHDPNDRYSLSHSTVFSIFQDRGNVFWVGTYDGLSIWNQASRAMLHYRHDADDSASLSADTVTSFAEDADGAIWVGTYGGGINALDRITGKFRQLRHRPDDDASLSSDRVMALHIDHEGVLWAGTRAAGLNKYDARDQSFTRFRHDPDDPESLSADGVTYILEDSNDGLWIATFGGGLNYFDRDTQKFRNYRSDPDDTATLSSDRVLVLFEDREQELWIGTYGGGLNRFDPTTNTFTRYQAEPGRPDGLSGDEIYMIEEDSLGDLWIGVKGSGLNRWRQADRAIGKESFHRFTEIDGLPSATVYSGIWDQSGDLWLSTARGLSRLDIETLEFRNYDNSHGLQGDEFNLAAGFGTSDGELFFGGVNGFNAFQPNELGATPIPPQVAITRFLSLNSPVDLSSARSDGSRIDLDYKQYFLGFEFTALDYAAAEKNRFMYKLEGLDEEWVDAGTKRQATYTNLPAGNYTFRVRAANNNGIWSDTDAKLDFHMSPAPWLTWWAYVAYALILAAIVLAAFRAHANRARRMVERKYAEDIRYRADYQAMLAGLSSELIRARPDDITQALGDGLETVGNQYGLDAISIWWLNDDRDTMQSYHRWLRVENNDLSGNIGRSEIPWLYSQLQSGQSVVVDDLAQMPTAAQSDQETLRQHGTKSFLMIPLLVDDDLEGACVFSTFQYYRNWSTQIVTELQLVAENLAGAVSRARAVTEIRELKEQLQEENVYLREEVRVAHGFDEIIGDDPKLRRCLQAVEKVAPTDLAVLILGETGTGKELIARALHNLSPRRDKPMVNVNCPALPAEIIESELFGHEKGAFTGALSQRRGRFELADGGTLFLDEIGELPLDLQSKLLRVLQTGEFERLGGTETICTDVRLIAATNRDLQRAQENRTFRSDLYFRISSFPIHLPPLRDRKSDIALLAEHFVHKHATRLGKRISAISAGMIRELIAYPWPGNVRELESIIERALIASGDGGVLELSNALPLITMRRRESDSLTAHTGLHSVERAHIIDILEKTNWKISGKDGAAFVLGIPPSTLRSKMKRLEITRRAS